MWETYWKRERERDRMAIERGMEGWKRRKTTRGGETEGDRERQTDREK